MNRSEFRVQFCRDLKPKIYMLFLVLIAFPVLSSTFLCGKKQKQPTSWIRCCCLEALDMWLDAIEIQPCLVDVDVFPTFYRKVVFFTERGAMGEKERQFLVGLNWLDEKTLKQSDGVRDGLLGSKTKIDTFKSMIALSFY